MKNTLIAVVVLAIVVAAGYFLYSGGGGVLDADVTLTFAGLEPLDGAHYEAWAIFERGRTSLGKFEASRTVRLNPDADFSDARLVVVTVEPAGDVDDVPSGTVILGGAVRGDGTADLSFPTDFEGASGTYILATPTNDFDGDETGGVWFVALPEPLSGGLIVPDLSAGWKYEGWAVIDGTPVSTGKFLNPAASDESDTFSGPLAGPAFPGEDFLENAPEGLSFPPNLADGSSQIVVSIEPDVNGVDPTGDGPFFIKPLIATVPRDAEDRENLSLLLDLDTFPSGTAKLNLEESGE